MKNNIVESVISFIIVILVLALADIFPFWMPNTLHMMLLALLIVAFALFAIYFWREKPRDERETLHRSTAGRIGFLVGGAVLTAGIVLQSYQHDLDIWLVHALVAMVLSKLLALIYSHMRQ